jgi:hypothetical protein
MRKALCISAVLLWSSFSGHALADFNASLVGYWNFDETSGSVAHSLVPQSDNGQLFNFPCDDSQWVPGQIGGALHLRGPDYQDYVIASFYPLATDAVSFSGWVNADVNTVTWQSIFKNWGGAHHGQFHFGLDGNSMSLGLYIAEASNAQVGPVEDVSFFPQSFPTGQWVHVGFVMDGSMGQLSVYVNGQLAGSGTYDGTLLNPPLMTSLGIGIKTDDTGTMADPGNPGYWQGSFDDFGLWTRALSGDEMAQIYTLGQNGQSFYGQ